MTITLTPDELYALTGYHQPAKQLAELHRQGFVRARRSAVAGAVILERTHYDAVCRGETERKRPQITPPRALLKAAA